MNIVKTCLCLGAVFLIFSCDDDQPEYQEGDLPITALSVNHLPENINEVLVEIPIKVQAPSGCWQGLRADYQNYKEKYYRFTGYGSYNVSAQLCPTVIVEFDTTLTLKLPGSGTYYFEANQAPFEVLYDTIKIE
jgi:hypothetical protein